MWYYPDSGCSRKLRINGIPIRRIPGSEPGSLVRARAMDFGLSDAFLPGRIGLDLASEDLSVFLPLHTPHHLPDSRRGNGKLADRGWSGSGRQSFNVD